MPPGMLGNDPITGYEFLTSLGMNNRMNELDFNGKFVLLAQNCRFQQMPGSVLKRDPLSYYNTTTMSTIYGVVGMCRFYSAYGPVLIAVCGSTVYVGNDSTGTMTAIRTLNTTSERTMFVTYNNLLMGFNGIDPIWVYDGSPSNVTWELGSCQALVAASGTGITATNVTYCVTIDDNAFICGATSNTITSLSNQAVSLNYIPLGPIGTIDRRIYRMDSGTGGAFKFVYAISDNSTITYTDVTPSNELGVIMGTTTDPIPVGSYPLIWQERLLIVGDPNNPNRMYYSEPYLPGYIQVNTGLDYLDIDINDGDQIQGLAVLQGTLLCIKQNNIRKLNVSSAESNVNPDTWSAEEPQCHSGTPARYSICQTPKGIVFLNWDMWYIYRGGAEADPFIPQFDVTQILPANYNNVITCYNDGMIFASYTSTSSGSQQPSTTMVYDMKLDQFGIDTYGAGSFASATGVNESGELYIGSAIQGFIYKAEQGDIWSSLNSYSQALQGTTAGTFIGGTQNTQDTTFIQIGAGVAPQSIPNGICLMWDDTTTTPGTGWTEITGYPYSYPVVSLTSGTTGGSSSHTHTITGTTSTVQGPSGPAGNQGGPEGIIQAHNHLVSGISDAMFANPAYFGLRIFYKNSSTTEYSFPVGSILMWDQQTPPDGWIPYGQSNNGYLSLVSPVASAANWASGIAYTVGQYVTATNPFTSQSTIYYCQIAHTSGAYDNQFNTVYGYNPSGSPNIPTSGAAGAEQQYPINPVTFADDLAAGFWIEQYSNLGVTVNPSHAHPYGVVNTMQTGYPNSSEIEEQSSSGNLNPNWYHTHFILGVTNGTTTGGNWDLDRLEINFIKKLVTGETPWDGTSKNVVALFWDTGAPASPSNGWSEVGATEQAYSSSTTYYPGAMVVYSSAYYQCTQQAQGQEPDTSPSYWQGGTYSSTTSYSIGQYAYYSSVNYVCTQAALNQTPASNSSYWQPIVVYLKSKQEYVTSMANNGYTHSHGNTPAITTSFPTVTWGNSSSRTFNEGMHQHIVSCSTNVISIPNPAWVSFRLWAAPLGKMTTWNNAQTTEYNNGLYYSPALQLNVQSFGALYYNASKLPADSINFYFNTAATSTNLTNGYAVTYATNTFTLANNGYSNGQRVSFQATSMPTGLSGTIMYYVVSAATNTFQVSTTNGGSAVTFSGGSGVSVFPWSDEIQSSDTIVAETPNVWVAYVVEFIAGNTTVSNPTLVMANGYLLQFSYSRSGTTAESSVEFIYTTGRMNAGAPYVDKIYKRIASDHSSVSNSGQVQVLWATENANNSMTFDLSQFPTKWSSFFQDMAMGETISITFYKNDLYDFNLRQFTLAFTSQPMLI